MRPFLVIFILFTAFRVGAASPKQELCPVDLKIANRSLYADRNGYRIFACSSNCLRRVKTDSMALINSMWAAGFVLEPSPKKPDAISGASKKKKKKRFFK